MQSEFYRIGLCAVVLNKAIHFDVLLGVKKPKEECKLSEERHSRGGSGKREVIVLWWQYYKKHSVNRCFEVMKIFTKGKENMSLLLQVLTQSLVKPIVRKGFQCRIGLRTA